MGEDLIRESDLTGGKPSDNVPAGQWTGCEIQLRRSFHQPPSACCDESLQRAELLGTSTTRYLPGSMVAMPVGHRPDAQSLA